MCIIYNAQHASLTDKHILHYINEWFILFLLIFFLVIDSYSHRFLLLFPKFVLNVNEHDTAFSGSSTEQYRRFSGKLSALSAPLRITNCRARRIWDNEVSFYDSVELLHEKIEIFVIVSFYLFSIISVVAAKREIYILLACCIPNICTLNTRSNFEFRQ